MTNPKIVIVGSGPSALAAAAAVVKKGFKPLVIDATIGGTNPNPDEFQTGPRESKKKIAKGSPGRKSWLGSDLPYRQHPRSILEFQNPEPVPSYSFGGFSRIWGASCSFYRELDEWFSKFGLTEEDCLLTAELLGFEDKLLQSTRLRHSKAAHDLMEKFYNTNFQKQYDVSFSNLAIKVELDDKDACQYCNQCLTGCPYGSIWMSGNKLLLMQEKNEIELITGYFLQEIKVELGRITSLIFDSHGVSHEILNPNYCFLATGVLSTTEILIKSKLASELEICDSSTAFSAMLKLGRKSGATTSDHSLSQVWITDRASGAHFQIYSPSPGLEAKMIENFSQLKRTPKLTRWLTARIIPIISYLPSKHSGTLRAKENGQNIIVSAHGSLHAKFLHHAHLAKISIKLLPKGYLFPTFLSKISNPGSGYHFGASLPMGKRTNELGQLPGLSNMSIVDASVLPLVEAGSITPSVMANSARIARTVCERVISA